MTDPNDINQMDEGPLQRWAKRKQQVREAQLEQVSEELPEAGDSIGNLTPADTEPVVTEPADQQLTDADMPALDSINDQSDVSGFFSPKVSAELRRLALRRLFSQPSYNIRDGLNDYDEDFTYFEPLGDIVTSDMRHQIELAEQRERERLAAEGQLAEEESETPVESDTLLDDPDPPIDVQVTTDTPSTPLPPSDEQPT